MLTDLDAELFPDDCEVVEIPSHDRRIYLIHKNGSSSLRLEAEAKQWRILNGQDLRSLDSVDVYLREPEDRYVSGINTFVQHLMRDNIGLDRHTCEIMALRYHFLNRHYVPQWHWVVNLARFLSPACQIRFHRVDELAMITDRRSRAGITPLQPEHAARFLPRDPKSEFWFLLDRILLGRCGQSLTWQEIKAIYRDHPAEPLRVVQSKMQQVRNVLC